MTIIIFFVILFVLVLVHEWGHFIVAKKTGMRVDEFGIGFPPKLLSKKWHGTEYSLNALPIGGFVRIYGENAADAAQDETIGQSTAGAFTTKSKWAQTAVLLAGVTMNILFAWALFALVFMIGVPTGVADTEATTHAKLLVTQIVPVSPAATAGLPAGAQVVSLTSNTATLLTLTPDAFSAFTQSHAHDQLTLTYLFKGKQSVIEMTPALGLIPGDATRAAIGVSVSLVDVVREPVLLALRHATTMTYDSFTGIVGGLVGLVTQIFHGTANFKDVAGPVGIVSLVGTAAQFGFASIVMFTAIISLNLAVINLLPFPALDGGRLLFVLIEGVIRRPINPVWVARVNLSGFALLMILMVAVTYNDIVRLFH